MVVDPEDAGMICVEAGTFRRRLLRTDVVSDVLRPNCSKKLI